ncbi:MAG: 50S ribosomal protein L29 [Rhodobacteraceae bacterium]|nr:50S ribosomal protein L29 [Paracoccaceae bacterium]
MTIAAELRNKTTDELTDELLKLKREAFNLRFQVADGSFTNTARIREVRRDVARVKTILRERAKK